VRRRYYVVARMVRRRGLLWWMYRRSFQVVYRGETAGWVVYRTWDARDATRMAQWLNAMPVFQW
jgi:hypothetical protein